MNKSNVRQRRSAGKDSPLSKRPKLDFTLKSKECPKDNKNNSKESLKGCNGLHKEKISGTGFVKNSEQETPQSASDWDEDFSGDMLEKVCLIADLSQAMVNNQPVPRELDQEKIDFEIFENNKVASQTFSPPNLLEPPKSGNSNENLLLELEKLKEKLKTKEGEVHILRSQLKQSEDAKQAVALQNIKVIEDIQKKYNDKIGLTEKELESTKSKLLFRDLEYKTLSERCRQLEYNVSKSKLGEGVNPTKSFILSQTVQSKPNTRETFDKNHTFVSDNFNNPVINPELPLVFSHEGKCLAKTICPEFFKFTNETSIVSLHNFHNEIDNERAGVDIDKKEKYKWSNLPKQTVFIIDLYSSVSNLFTYNNFLNKEAQKIVQAVFESCVKILTYQKQVLSFLEELQLCSDYDDADQSLLQNEDEVNMVTLKNLIDGEKLNEEECGIEGRRSLALLYALIKTSQIAFDKVKNNSNFINLLKDLATLIGTLRRPLRYSGILLGITKILQQILEEENLTKEYLTHIIETVEELIFSRPKINVLLEVIKLLTTGKKHIEFLMAICRKESTDSCTLYMDCKLKQAMFFTKSACPLKLLCMQVMSLACMPSSKSIRWELTDCIIKWLNSSISTPFCKKIKWLPINSASRQELCFNVTECLLYLLTLCIKDYLLIFSQEGVTFEKFEVSKKKVKWIVIIAEGSVLLKRILRADQRQLLDNMYYLRFAALLKAFLPGKSDLCRKTHLSHMSSLQVEAITWITDFLESDLRNQDCIKQNTSALSDIEFFNALKINEDPKIY